MLDHKSILKEIPFRYIWHLWSKMYHLSTAIQKRMCNIIELFTHVDLEDLKSIKVKERTARLQEQEIAFRYNQELWSNTMHAIQCRP